MAFNAQNKNSVQNDKQIYLDFLAEQKRLRNNYAGAASNNVTSDLAYGGMKQGYEKYSQKVISPSENKFNVFDRPSKRPVPRTREMFRNDGLTMLMQPQKEMMVDRFNHDKLNTKDIPGVVPDTYGKFKRIQGKTYNGDIEGTKPRQLKQNRITNIPDYKINVKDIDSPGAMKFKTNRISDPLNPSYKIETASRRHVIQMGAIDGNAPK